MASPQDSAMASSEVTAIAPSSRTSSSRRSSSSKSARDKKSGRSVPSVPPSPPHQPAKRTGKTKHIQCALCSQPLPDNYLKKLCQSCIESTLREESSVRSEDIRSMIREELQAFRSSEKIPEGRKKYNSPRSEQSSGTEDKDSDGSQRIISSDDERDTCFPTDSIDNLVRSVCNTMGIEDTKIPKTPQDVMFAGLSERKKPSFPVIPAIKNVVKKEWESQGQRGLPSSSKRRYPFNDEDFSIWLKAPKVDAAVASTSKKSLLPVEDSGSLQDPLDRKADTILKRAWESCTGAFRPAISATCTARSMLVWLNDLEEGLKSGLSRDRLISSIPLIRGATAFLADSSADSIRLAAKSAGLTQWLTMTSNPWATSLISTGLKLRFARVPPDSFLLTSLKSHSQQEALEQEIINLLSKGVLVEVPSHQKGRGFYSPLFLIPKPDGSFRTIINLKRLNVFLENQTFKMESIRSTIKLLFPHCFMAVLDLKDAYYHLPIFIEHQQYLRVAVIMEGQIRHYQYTAMPFGLSIAPRVFTKLMSEVMSYLRLKDTLVIPYLDDLLIVGNSLSQCHQRVLDTISSLQELGWLVNWEKSRLSPTTRQTFLGLILDSTNQRCFLPDSKQLAIINKVQSVINKPLISLREGMSLLGSFTSCIPAVPWAQFHSRKLQYKILQEEERLQGQLDSRLSLPSDVVDSLTWWLDQSHFTSGVPWVVKPSKTLFTDASPSGWGAHLGDQIVQGLWSPRESNDSSNQKELKAIYHAICKFLPQLHGTHTRIFSDNMTAVAYINHQGGTRSEALMCIAGDILSIAEEHLLSLSALHVRGVDNPKADFLSRHTLRQGEWVLSRRIFLMIIKKWGTPERDLFATRHNRQVKRFASLFRSDNPDIFDALQVPWTFQKAYAFPPLILLPTVIRKIREDRAHVILIAPFWPKRPWFSWLRIMSISDPWILPEDQDLLSQGPFNHPQVKGLRLTAWHLRGGC
ncbi:uncharacterized protein LOC143764961 [Ranitomeya variabilis]|uniref:uncharacterized protein LOC143764961 n=1 Tax=Ranitomeya variabilis TaxID=490064 RepID=UPI0040576E4A